MEIKKTNNHSLGILVTGGSYLIWGILPIYWKMVQSVPSHEILAHRFFWSFVFVLALLLVIGKFRSFICEFRQIASQPKKLFAMFLASALISVNWFTYIWAVNHNHIIETSLGYYLNPLISVLLGIIVLKEKLSFWQMFSFLLATLGVLNMALHSGAMPWIVIILATSFALYGLSKKMVNVSAITGIAIETLFMTPFALGYLLYVHKNGAGAFGLDVPYLSLLLMGAGVVTAVPLILFASGAKRLPLSLVGFLQYIAPTLALMIGVFIYHEPFNHTHLLSFSIIWFALVIFSLAKTKPFIQLETILYKKLSHGKRQVT
ncbi:EamA family transporter RarD [Desulfotomaculum sp. 1211_IL3151]|uniref:EamA family transporter RarD n=1 Tax=Desulfotomaculum sp. 1211_IL3151 TaxID=3084055 RepID=UPI002FDA840A